jgi:DNA helicase-2/ATP-dependent DNA helicase PcrA
MFHADLHIHSRFSRACSKTCDIPSLAWWALRKGITVVGTGDFTHPAWAQELRETLVPAEPGLLRLRPDLEARLRRTAPASCGQQVRFMLSSEISTIYRGGERTRKVHHLLYAPTFEAADRITATLATIGNLASDGRPILGLDSRHLLEITLNAGPGCYLVPAHIWTPWFAALGSKSGFDAIADCYADLAEHVFAVETGLSSDPPMNWMCSSLDGYQLVSNSDAHSPPMIGREATTLGTEIDYFAIEAALRTGTGLAGTINFFPEGGRYHLDGHRKCGIRFEPGQTTEHGGTCPECGKPLTIGVLHRITELADRAAGGRPDGAAGSTNLVALPEIVGEILATGAKSKKVSAEVSRLVAALGPELAILCETPIAEVNRVGGSLLGEAVARLRRGEVIKDSGYDGEYGSIRLFRRGELDAAGALFDIPAPPQTARPIPAKRFPAVSAAASSGVVDALSPGVAHRRAGPLGMGDGRGTFVRKESKKVSAADSLLEGLDLDQRAAAMAGGPLMIIAGPGTGKTRTLTHRIAAAITRRVAAPESCLAITFTRRAAEEMRERMAALIPRQAPRLTVTTFHGLGLMILREQHERAGLSADFCVADEQARQVVAAELAGSPRSGRALLTDATSDPARRDLLRKALTARDLVDFDGLVELPVTLLRDEPSIAAALRDRWPYISVDEYQDIDATQYALLRLLSAAPGSSDADGAGTGGAGIDGAGIDGAGIDGAGIDGAGIDGAGIDGAGLTVIGDPDQAIYGFRGADVGYFLRFAEDYPGATTLRLTRNYRSSPAIVAGALQAIAPSTLVPGRVLRAVAAAPPPAANSDRSDHDRGGSVSQKAGNPPRSWNAGPATAITFHEAADEHGEAAWIAEAIDRLLGGSSFHSLDSGRADGHGHDGIGLADIAVLYRTDAQAGPLGQALTRSGLPFQKRSHDLLERRTGVPEIVHEMRLMHAEAMQTGASGPPVPATQGTPTAAGALSVLYRLRRAVNRLASSSGGPGSTAVDIRAAGEVLAPLARRCGDDSERFLTEISLGAEADALDPRADAITLLTLHAAKGLEFAIVFVAGCEKGLLPLWLPGMRPEAGLDQAEERRLLFVGMTRARTHLLVTCAARRRRHGATADGGPSPFLAAIEPRLLDRSAPTSPRRSTARQLRLL